MGKKKKVFRTARTARTAPDQPDMGNEWAAPNIEGKSPRAAFNAFLDHAKKILHPTALADLLRPELEAIGSANPEDSLIELRDKLRPVCSTKKELLRSRLAELAHTVEHYVKSNATNLLVPERLSWMIAGVAAWTSEVHSDNDMDMGGEKRLVLQTQRLREDEKWAAVDPLERTIETALRDGFLKAVFETKELRVELGHRLEEIAASIATGTAIPDTPTEVASPPPNFAPLKWTGTTQQLAWLLRGLAEKGWIDAPRHKRNTGKWRAGGLNANKYGQQAAPHFEGITANTLSQELKPEGQNVRASEVEGWAIPKKSE